MQRSEDKVLLRYENNRLPHNGLSYEKAREDLMMQIAKMYYLGQATAEQITLVKANVGDFSRDMTFTGQKENKIDKTYIHLIFCFHNLRRKIIFYSLLHLRIKLFSRYYYCHS